jgi:hypothetical protein
MRTISVAAFYAFIVRTFALDLVEESMVDNLVDELVDTSQIDLSDLDDTTLAAAATSPVARVHAIQNQMKAFGVPSSPLQEMAVTAMVATRDVRAKAHIPRVFSSMDSEQKDWIREQAQYAENLVKQSDEKLVNVREMAGATPPLGFWDPLRITTRLEGNSILYVREAELKHGRVCMLAFLGMVVGEKYHPFFGGNIDLPVYNVKAMFLETSFKEFWILGTFIFGGLEALSIRTQYDAPYWEFGMKKGEDDMLPSTQFMSKQLTKKERLPGELGFDPLGLKPKDPAELKTMQSKEINNGRLAMLAVAGVLGQELASKAKTFT